MRKVMVLLRIRLVQKTKSAVFVHDSIDWGVLGSAADAAGNGAGGINWNFEVSPELAVESTDPAEREVATDGIDWGAVSLEGLDLLALDGTGAAAEAEG